MSGGSRAVNRPRIRLPIARWRRWCDFRAPLIPFPEAFVTGCSQAVKHARRRMAPSRGRKPRAMDRVRWALSWLVVFAVGLAPILVYWVAGVIGRAFRHKRGGPPAGSGAVPGQGRQEGAGARPREAAPPGLPPTGRKVWQLANATAEKLSQICHTWSHIEPS